MVDLREALVRTAPQVSPVRVVLRYLLLGLAGAGGWALTIDHRVAEYLLRARPWTDRGE